MKAQSVKKKSIQKGKQKRVVVSKNVEGICPCGKSQKLFLFDPGQTTLDAMT